MLFLPPTPKNTRLQAIKATLLQPRRAAEGSRFPGSGEPAPPGQRARRAEEQRWLAAVLPPLPARSLRLRRGFGLQDGDKENEAPVPLSSEGPCSHLRHPSFYTGHLKGCFLERTEESSGFKWGEGKLSGKGSLRGTCKPEEQREGVRSQPDLPARRGRAGRDGAEKAAAAEK